MFGGKQSTLWTMWQWRMMKSELLAKVRGKVKVKKVKVKVKGSMWTGL